MSSPRRQHIIALGVTLLFHIGVVILLAVLYLRYSPSDQTERRWPPVDSSEVLFGGEFVMIGDQPELAESSDLSAPAEAQPEPAPQPQVESTVNTGKPAPTPAPMVTSERPSPAKTARQERPTEPTGPTKAEIEAAERAKREEETRRAIAGRVNFGKSSTQNDKGSGRAGSPNGNSTVGAASGTPGHNLKGRTIASWVSPEKAPLGTITVSVSVNRQGQVTSATYLRGTGAAATSQAARQSCIRAAMGSKFSVNNDAPASQKGTITYHFK